QRGERGGDGQHLGAAVGRDAAAPGHPDSAQPPQPLVAARVLPADAHVLPLRLDIQAQPRLCRARSGPLSARAGAARQGGLLFQVHADPAAEQRLRLRSLRAGHRRGAGPPLHQQQARARPPRRRAPPPRRRRRHCARQARGCPGEHSTAAVPAPHPAPQPHHAGCCARAAVGDCDRGDDGAPGPRRGQRSAEAKAREALCRALQPVHAHLPRRRRRVPPARAHAARRRRGPRRAGRRRERQPRRSVRLRPLPRGPAAAGGGHDGARRPAARLLAGDRRGHRVPAVHAPPHPIAGRRAPTATEAAGPPATRPRAL
ncbi:hypothetical protein IWQ56_005494, partial [Coemansia nantahalensis]